MYTLYLPYKFFDKKNQFAGILLCKVGAGLGSVILHNIGTIMIVLK